MKCKFLSACAVLAICSGFAGAQVGMPATQVVAQPNDCSGTTFVCEPPSCDLRDGSGPGGRFWANGELLLWWLKDAPLPAVLVTTGPVSGNSGALNAGGVPVFGGPFDPDLFVGFRLTAGAWLNSSGDIGFEVGGFDVPTKSKTFSAFSDGNGNPVLAFRYIDAPTLATPFAEDAFQASIPGVISGGLSVRTSTSLDGIEANAVANLIANDTVKLQGLLGFRYMNLTDDLQLLWSNTALAADSVFFQGTPLSPPATVTSADFFHTRTNFYGAQIGVRGEMNFSRLFVGFSAKVALGDNSELVQISGISGLAGTNQTTNVGQFAGPSNIGRFTDNDFSVIPEVEVKAGFNITDHLRAFVGYDFLYWTSVVRANQQLDLIVDTRADPVNGTFGTLAPTFVVPPTFPRVLFARSGFWAQGIDLGLEFRF